MAEASRRARAAKAGSEHDTAMTEGAGAQWALGAGAGGGVWDRAARWRQADRQAAGKDSASGQHSQQVPASQSRNAGHGSATARPAQKQKPSDGHVQPRRSQPCAPCEYQPGRQLTAHELPSSQGVGRQSAGFAPQTRRAPNFPRLHAAWSARLAAAKAAVQRGLTIVQVSALCPA